MIGGATTTDPTRAAQAAGGGFPGATALFGDASTPQRTPDYQKAPLELLDRSLAGARRGSMPARHRADWWNCLLYRGGDNHWKVWNKNSQEYVDRGTDPETGGIPAWCPRNVTNMFALKVDGIAAILDQTEPAKDIAPATDDDRDRAAADVAQDALPVILEELAYDIDRAQLHKLITLTSSAGYALYYDNDESYGTEDVVAQECDDCHTVSMPAEVMDAGKELGQEGVDAACPECKSPNVHDAINPQTGMPIGKSFAKGKLCGKVLHGFELTLPAGARTADTRRLPWLAAHTRMPVEQIVKQWPKLRGLVNDSGGRGGDHAGGAYADALLGLVGPMGNESRGASSQTGPVVTEFWHDPIETEEFYFPEGLYLVTCAGAIGEAGPLPYVDDDGRPFKNILIRQFAAAPGNGAGKPPADDLAPLQVQRNIVESLYDLSLMHFASPKMFIPISVTMVDEPNGAPGGEYRYRSTVPGEVPRVEPGIAPPQALQSRIDKIDESMDAVSRLNAVLAGERPAGDPTLGEVQMLDENGKRAFRGPLDSLVYFERELAVMALRIARQTMWTPRFSRIRGDNGKWEVKQFLGADLDGHLDVTIDKATAWPKSLLAQSLRLKQAAELGAIPQPLSLDPEMAVKYLAKQDLGWLKPSIDADAKQIARDLDAWRAATDGTTIARPDPVTQNLKLHLDAKKAFLKTEEADAKRKDAPEAYAAMRSWILDAQQLVQPQMPGGAPGAPGQPAAPAPGPAGPSPAPSPAGPAPAQLHLHVNGAPMPAPHVPPAPGLTGPQAPPGVTH